MVNKTKTKSAFTLAEVLITLVIIGVVAALTIPTAIAKYQKEQTVARLKQVFSQLNQSVRLSVPKYGDPRTWDYSLVGINFFNKYLSNYIKVKNMTLNTNEITYRRTDGLTETGFNPLKDGADVVVLNSGAIMYFSHTSTQYKTFVIDINGLKGPNKIGRDLFFFVLDRESGMFIPRQFNDNESPTVERKREELKNGPSSYNYQCNKSGRGMWCAALIMADGWQIKDDYPW